MSGGAPAVCAAAGRSVGAVAVSADDREKRWPATSAMSATRAIAATAHGNAEPRPRSEPTATARESTFAPAGVPQRWQNFAPGVSAVPHAPHWAPASGAPQFEQNFPDAGAWQVGHAALPAGCDTGAGLVMREL